MDERPRPDFTLDEIAKEIAQELLNESGLIHNDPGLTVNELAKMWNVAAVTARRRVQELKRKGKIIEGLRSMRNVDGDLYHARVIRLKKDEEKGGETE